VNPFLEVSPVSRSINVLTGYHSLAPLFFPATAPKKPPPPFPRRNGSGSMSRSFSRTSSVSSIYHPPPPPPQPEPPAPVPGRTPGRRGEKRRQADDEENKDEKRRKAGKIVPLRLNGVDEESPRPEVSDTESMRQPPLLPPPLPPDEDIFGTRPPKIVLDSYGLDRSATFVEGAEPPSTGRGKRLRVPQQILDNEAVSRPIFAGCNAHR